MGGGSGAQVGVSAQILAATIFPRLRTCADKMFNANKTKYDEIYSAAFQRSEHSAEYTICS